MINEKILNQATTNGFVFKKPIDPILGEKIILKIVADHNDVDYLTECTDIDVHEINFDLFFKAIRVMFKLVQAKSYRGNEKSWHIIDLYTKLTEEDINALYDFDMAMIVDDEDKCEIEEYSIMDMSDWEGESTIRSWFPYPEYDTNNSDYINCNHSLISVTMQYHDGKGNIFNIEAQ